MVLGSTESGAVWERIQLDIARANRGLSPSQKAARVYFEVNAAPFAAGKTSFIGELLDRLGMQNIATEKMGAFPKINPEFVVQSRPDLIMTTEASPKQLAQRPAGNPFQRFRAIGSASFRQHKPMYSFVPARAWVKQQTLSPIAQ
jgi:iron complex transport system substrate-binding protein